MEVAGNGKLLNYLADDFGDTNSSVTLSRRIALEGDWYFLEVISLALVLISSFSLNIMLLKVVKSGCLAYFECTIEKFAYPF